ncbi:LLM class flavin-dependent oxidoreductase [Streptomyces sp. NBC_01190]|uniref:LLM class flavin-dependent oxidoreductase n=1 Tax=Streptomyces sp. NBC_01190 TaxID=2903767 RepID=UPI00386945E5|nr:LLM class flavin-dependent oxidoreductase [Streptomyces sp. NBC_01190]
MTDGRVSFLFPQQPTDPRAILPYGRLVRDSPFRALWVGQSVRIESHPALAYLAGAGCQIPVGISVALTALRNPYDAALQARSLAALMERPVSVGYGAADPAFVTGLTGAPYAKPAAAVEEYVTAVRALLRGGRVRHKGALYDIDYVLPEMEHAPVEVGAGVLRPVMARAAGRAAEVAMTWLTPPHYLRDTVVPALAAGAEQAGRPRPPRLVAMVPAAFAGPGRNPMLLAQNTVMNHMRKVHYTDMLRRAGLDVDRSDPIAGARELVDEGVFIYGKPGDLAREIRRYHEVGVDEVVLNVTGVVNLHGDAALLDDLHALAAELD